MKSSELLEFSLADVVMLQIWPREPAKPIKHCTLLPAAQGTRERQIRDAEAKSKGGSTEETVQVIGLEPSIEPRGKAPGTPPRQREQDDTVVPRRLVAQIQ